MPGEGDDVAGDDDLELDDDDDDVDELVLDDEAPRVGAEDDLPGDADELVKDAVEVGDEDEEEEEEAVAEGTPEIRPPLRPQPGRPPSAREEPPPPFAIGERVVLVQNTRPRTGTPIGNYPVGATGRVETVLSQTAIVRFDIAPDTKEVVAFTCLESAEKGNGAKRPDGPGRA
jgi:hypothetical protein